MIALLICLVVVNFILVGVDLYMAAKRFDKIIKAIDRIALNGPLIKVDKNPDVSPSAPMSKRAKRMLIERKLAQMEQ
jgi:hypothetical protein